MGGGTADDPDGSVPDRRLAQAALAAQHNEPTLCSRAAGRLTSCQLRGIVGAHGEHTASGEQSGQGQEAIHQGSGVSLLPYCSTTAAGVKLGGDPPL
jgi:hypothetical protein